MTTSGHRRRPKSRFVHHPPDSASMHEKGKSGLTRCGCPGCQPYARQRRQMGSAFRVPRQVLSGSFLVFHWTPGMAHANLTMACFETCQVCTSFRCSVSCLNLAMPFSRPLHFPPSPCGLWLVACGLCKHHYFKSMRAVLPRMVVCVTPVAQTGWC